MATHIPPGDLDLQEQLARIRQIGLNTEKIILENQRLQLERLKVEADTEKAIAEVRKLAADTRVVSVATVFQGLIAVAALIGAGAAIAKLFFP
jgi:hypothetical protein